MLAICAADNRELPLSNMSKPRDTCRATSGTSNPDPASRDLEEGLENLATTMVDTVMNSTGKPRASCEVGSTKSLETSVPRTT